MLSLSTRVSNIPRGMLLCTDLQAKMKSSSELFNGVKSNLGLDFETDGEIRYRGSMLSTQLSYLGWKNKAPVHIKQYVMFIVTGQGLF